METTSPARSLMLGRRTLCLVLFLAAFVASATGSQADDEECRCVEEQEILVTPCIDPEKTSIASRAQDRGIEIPGSGFVAIYGEDNRQDYHKADSQWRTSLAASVAIVPRSRLSESQSGRPELTHEAKSLRFSKTPPLCCGERFCKQPAAASCSGILVGRNTPIVLTASHCFSETNTRPDVAPPSIDTVDFVVKYRIASTTQAPRDFPEMIRCSPKLGPGWPQNSSGKLWVALELDCGGAALPNPVDLGNPDDYGVGDDIVSAGYPQGLPAKLADRAKILAKKEATKQLVTNLDAFEGSSGSGIFRRRFANPTLIGLLEGGMPDYQIVSRGGHQCLRTCVYNGSVENGAVTGEIVTAVTQEMINRIKVLDGP